MKPLDLYHKFDAWTKKTGILDGSGLTWIGRIPAEILVTFASLAVWGFHSITAKQES